MIVAIFPGTFDPFTFGHLDVTERAAKLFDEVVVMVANHNTKKIPLFSLEDRCSMIEKACAHLKNVSVKVFDTLQVTAASDVGASVVIRGLRVTSDFEYEFMMRQFNAELDHEKETVYLMSSGRHLHISSSHVKEIAHLGGDIKRYVPEAVQTYMKKVYGDADTCRNA